MALSSRVSSERIKKGMTQEELASLANITVRTIQRIESGESLPRMYTIKAIASALEIPFESLAQKPESSPENSTAIDLESEHHFLHLFCLSCFSYIVVPYIHFLIPSWISKKKKIQSLPVKKFVQKIIRQQVTWVIAFHLLLILTLVYNFILAKYGNREYLVNYLLIVIIMYLLNAILIGSNLLKIKKVTIS